MYNLSNIVVKIPDLSKSYLNYSQPDVKKANMDMCRKIYNNYSSSLINWGNTFQIPVKILVGFIATESGGNNLKPNRYQATGLMQVTPGAVYETFRKYKQVVKSDLPDNAKAAMNSKVPEVLGSKSESAAVSSKILNLLEKDPDFNILCGTTYIRFALEMYSYRTILLEKRAPLNKVLVGYNAGVYLGALKEQPNQSSDTLFLATNRRVPSESRSYLYKMLGIDGYLQLLFSDLPKQGFNI